MLQLFSRRVSHDCASWTGIYEALPSPPPPIWVPPSCFFENGFLCTCRVNTKSQSLSLTSHLQRHAHNNTHMLQQETCDAFGRALFQMVRTAADGAKVCRLATEG